MRRKRPTRMPDDGLVGWRGKQPTFPWVVQHNSASIMYGFDGLPKTVRDLLNYAETPEGGAQGVQECLAHEFGPDVARKFLTRRRM
jgi:hypothetical protein